MTRVHPAARVRIYVDTPTGGTAHIRRIDGLTYCGRPAVGLYSQPLPDDQVCASCLRSRRNAEAGRT